MSAETLSSRVSEVRVMDDITITGPTQRVVGIPCPGRYLISIVDVRTITGGVTLTVDAWDIDPGQKSKESNGTILGHANVPANTVSEYQGGFNVALSGLVRVEYTLSGLGSVTFTHTLIFKTDLSTLNT